MKVVFDESVFTTPAQNPNVIVCTLQARVYLSESDISDLGPMGSILNYTDTLGGKPIVGKGYARCHKNDTFDEVHGQHIAETRAKAKVYRELEKVFNILDKMNKKSYETSKDIHERMTYLKNRELGHLDYLQKLTD